MVVTKNGIADTSNFVQFTDYSPTPISILSTAQIIFNSSTYTISLFGIYTINLTYNWIVGPITRIFTFNLGDACTAGLSKPIISSTATYNQLDADWIPNITPLYESQYSYCLFSVTVSTQKDGVSDTSKNYVQFNDLADVAATNAIITFKNSIYNP